MSRMRYGPRFGQQIVDASAPYDAAMDKMSKRDRIIAAKINENTPQYKRELYLEKGRKKLAARVNVLGEERRSAEAGMAEAIRAAAQLLERHMTDLMDHRALGGKWRSRLNQRQIFNIIVELKTKCGVDFGNGINAESIKKVHLTPAYHGDRYWEDPADLMARQKADRLSSIERVKKRLLDRK